MLIFCNLLFYFLAHVLHEYCKPLHRCLDLKGGNVETAAQTVTGSGTAGSADGIPKELTSRMLGKDPAYESETGLLLQNQCINNLKTSL